MPVTNTISLHETARKRYLNYALSVITSRALPDIRDGLKPVQRRILFAMFDNLNLYPDKRHRKSATVVGDTMGKYHPHGDKAIYDAMVRMAQPFSLRAPLVDGHGNFGSIDGDNAAAMRYTEAKLQPLAMEMLEELRDNTVDYRDNFDGTTQEPVVLPSRVPNLLVNGASGIAVGMATNIPPHNLGEVVGAALRMVDEPEVSTETLVEDHIQGPDFPTGGRLLNTEEELKEIYDTGKGTIEMRGSYRTKGKTRAIVESIPYGVDKSKIVEEIADHIAEENVPQLSNVRDESTDDVRIVLELKRGSDTEAAMAYLYKHTKLQQRFHVNLTCLVPTGEGGDVKAPQKVDLRTVLRHFLDFRMDVVMRRLRHELSTLEDRIHILEGFETIFDALDEAIKMIRASKDKSDAAQRLMHRFQLDREQTDAILETQLYKLSQMEVEAIHDELENKRKRADEIRALLDDEAARWDIIKDELREVREQFSDERRSTIVGPEARMEYTEEDYIVEEDVHVIVTRDGWVKRQGTYSDVDSIRVRDGDEVGWVLPGSTRATVGFFTNYGTCYTTRIAEIPSTTGYGDPVQKLFSFDDGEHVVGVVSFDDRVLPDPVPPEPTDQGQLFDLNGEAEDAPDEPYVLAISKGGQATRFTLDGYKEPSTRTGRMYMRFDGDDEAVGARLARGHENVCLASHDGRALVFPVHQVSVYKNAAKGVRAINLEEGDRVIGFTLSDRAREGLTVETNNGREEIVRTTKFDVTNRGAKGTLVIKRGYFAEVFPEPVIQGENG